MIRLPLRSEARLRLIEKRQSHVEWGPHYQPSMQATRNEAPSISRPSTMYSKKLGRELHFMSLAERAACLLALYSPQVFDVHEQHMLSPYPIPHPLAGREDTQGLALKPLQGTIAVLERLGQESEHPIIWQTHDANGRPFQEPIRAAFPYLGDLLIFLRDDQGPYCVNWTVKKNPQGFLSTGYGRLRSEKSERQANASAALRHQIEEMYFTDAGVRTVRVPASLINPHVCANLTHLVGYDALPKSVISDSEQRMLNRFRESIGTRISPLSLFAGMQTDFACTRRDCQTTLYQGIWNRDLRVDLYHPILLDKPLRIEQSDVLVDYAAWLRR